jgi:hypothetical protein
MTMREYIIELLKAIEAAIPPPSNCHHCLTYAKYGSDSEGWTGKLALQLNREGKFYCFFLEESDLAPEAEDLEFAKAELQKGWRGEKLESSPLLEGGGMQYVPSVVKIQSIVAKLLSELQLPDSSFQMGVGPGRYL